MPIQNYLINNIISCEIKRAAVVECDYSDSVVAQQVAGTLRVRTRTDHLRTGTPCANPAVNGYRFRSREEE